MKEKEREELVSITASKYSMQRDRKRKGDHNRIPEEGGKIPSFFETCSAAKKKRGRGGKIRSSNVEIGRKKKGIIECLRKEKGREILFLGEYGRADAVRKKRVEESKLLNKQEKGKKKKKKGRGGEGGKYVKFLRSGKRCTIFAHVPKAGGRERESQKEVLVTCRKREERKEKGGI